MATDITPAFDAFAKAYDAGKPQIVARALVADLDTPVSAWLKLGLGDPYAFLLESVEGGERIGRYSFIGVDPSGMIVVKDGVVTHTQNGQTQTYPLAEGQDDGSCATPCSMVRRAAAIERSLPVMPSPPLEPAGDDEAAGLLTTTAARSRGRDSTRSTR